MVTSAVLGAATGTGLALLVAMTIVVYRYYSVRRYGKEWNYLERFGDSAVWAAPPPKKSKRAGYTISTTKVFNLAKEKHIVQPSSAVTTHSELHSPLEVTSVLPHQYNCYPAQTSQPQLARTHSVTSASSTDTARQSHRGSSPHIRTFTPDGRGYPLFNSGGEGPLPSQRSPSPTPSLSQSSLSSISSAPRSPRARCLSPLLLPPRTPSQDLPPASPLGTLQPDLYHKKEGPLFLQGAHRGPSLGRLHLRLKYDFDRSDLHVHLIEAHDLAGSGQGGFNDPYVRLTLSPKVDSRKRQTSIHRNDPNPFFDQHFKFPVSHEDLQDKLLILQVFDFDRFSRNDVTGEVQVGMAELDVTSSVEVWGEITKHKKPPEELQEVLFSLSYLPSAERLTVVLLKARNLFRPQEKETVDPFVKVYLTSGGKRIKKKKTAARKATANPVWNEALTFNVPSNNLSQSAVEVCVMDQSSDMTPVLGCCLIGPHEEGTEQDHWMDMAQSPRKAVAMWHTLR